MRPSPTPSTFFAADQDWLFRVRTWDTPQTTLENDTASVGLRLRVYQPIAETTNWTAYADALKAVADGTSPETAFTSATYASSALRNSSGTAVDGRWPLIQTYWGSGAPNWWGGARARRVALCYQGTIVPAAQRAWLSNSNDYTFALAGSGWARIDVVDGGTRTTIFRGDLSEPVFLSAGFSYSKTHTFTATSELHVYYVQTANEPWGGLVVKAIAGSRPTGLAANGTAMSYTGTAATEAIAAAAPTVSCGLFSFGSVSPVILPFITRVSVNQEPGAASRAEIEVPLINPTVNDGNGWTFYQSDPELDPGALRVYDGGTLTHTLKRKRLIQLQVARNAASPTWSTIFTGVVDDFDASGKGRMTIRCVSFEGRMVEQYEQAPDRISYMARGFRVLDYETSAPADRKEPVYNVPAFDNWPLEWAVEELANRAGIDPSCFRKAYQAVKADGTGVAVTLPWGAAQRFAARSFSGEQVRLPRPVHYGNVGLSFTEKRPYDDEYVFKIEPTKDLWARVRELTDKLGYVCRFDVEGAAILYPATSPSFVRDLVTGDVTSGAGNVTQVINPSAYGAKYLQVASNTAATISATVQASRIDVSFPRVTGARNWTATVTRVSDSVVVFTGTITQTSSSPALELFFDATVAQPGSNSTVFTLYSGDYTNYTVTLTAASAASVAYVDCLLCYAQDPDNAKLPTLSTSDAALSVQLRAQQDAVRNKVTIVGRRKAAVTDSDKFDEAQGPTEQEFVVQNAVDINSISNPSALNYVGYLKQAVIYDESISDDGLARYLAQVFIYRQSVPRAGTSVSHTLLPMLEPGDPIAVSENMFDTMTSSMTQYVRKVTHDISANRFETTVETEAWPEYPAYQPRTDINLADFANKPITGMTINYVSISGQSITDPGADDVKRVEGNLVEQANVTFTGTTLNVNTGLQWPPVPGTFQIKPNYAAGTTRTAVLTDTARVIGQWRTGDLMHAFTLGEDWFVTGVRVKLYGLGLVLDAAATDGSTNRDGYFYYHVTNRSVTVFRGSKGSTSTYVYAEVTLQYQRSTGDARNSWLTNNPYHRFLAINYTNAASPRVQIPWEQVSGFVRDDGITSFNVRYRSLFEDVGRTDPNGAAIAGVSQSPFYDPYTSELGYLVSFRCSVLAEGLYRVSIRNWEDDTIVAWLTNPAGDPLEEEEHWEYIPVMANRQFTWDGVDQVGVWNSTQSELYSTLVEGTFEDGQRPRVGRGFYCWNREISGGELGPLAYVWMQRDPTTGLPYIGHGTYGRWYVHVEAQTTTEAETEVSSRDSDLAILTHLPEPTKLELSVQDWSGSAWVSPTTGVSTSTVNAYINNAKPVRIRFRVAQRPGQLWTSTNKGEVTVKLTREAHLRAVIGDQTVVYRGKEFAGTSVEDRAIYNRRLVNDEHTRQYVDSGYRKAKTFKWNDGTDTGDAVTEWVFQPSDFKKDFLVQGYEESIEFGNYLQLEEVPEWNGTRELTAARSRLQFALMSYLFYLSAYVTDRSGRSSWGINRSFVDKSKIYSNTATLDWPTDPMYEHRRTVVCRQWTGETAWKTAQLSAFGYNSTTLFNQLLEAFWWQHDVTSVVIGTTPAPWAIYALPMDPYANTHVLSGNSFSEPFVLPGGYTTSNRQLGDVVAGAPTCLLGKTTSATVTGTWNWESNPLWIPSITRDLHPFFRLPPMISPPKETGANPRPGIERDYRPINCYWTVGGPDIKVTVGSPTTNGTSSEANTNDAAAAETWSSPVGDYSYTTGNYPSRFWPGQQVDVKEKPFKDLSATDKSKFLNYVRQDEMVHYEDVRGVYSRSRYPTAGAVKVSAGSAYYLNPFRYRGIEVGRTLNDSPFPQYHVIVDRNNVGLDIEWFRTAFRSEYVWESGSMFPGSLTGRERLEGVLWWKHRYTDVLPSTLYYDFGAWVGWKDDRLAELGTDVVGGRRTGGNYTSSEITVGNPFTTGFMPVGVGPVLPETTELACHLVLLTERRGS